jgi:hypothetical protein
MSRGPTSASLTDAMQQVFPYRCTNCGNQIDVGSTTHLPPCAASGNGTWETVTGGDSVQDPYPDR